MGSLFQDFKQSFRMLAKSPAFSLAAIAALALGIGVNTAIFSVVNAVLLKPLTYPDPDRMVQFLSTSPNGNNPAASITKFHNWQQQTSVFQDVAAYDFGGPGFNLTGAVQEQVHGIHVTHDYFALFGAPIQLGRTFTQEEDLPNGGRVVVLSNGFWKRKFGGNRRSSVPPSLLAATPTPSSTFLAQTSRPIPSPTCGSPSSSIPTARTRGTSSSPPAASNPASPSPASSSASSGGTRSPSSLFPSSSPSQLCSPSGSPL
jgi:MacB-like periplasmic core domain